MIIDFINPIQPIDVNAERAFIEILNLILLTEHADELNRRLQIRDFDEKHLNLSGYFKWSFDNYSFTLWQRIGYKSKECFKVKALEIKHVTMISQDRHNPNAIKN